MIVSIETEYYLGDEILYETTAIRDKSVVPVFMLNKIQSITISCPNGNREYSLKYEIEGGKFLTTNEIKCNYNSIALGKDIPNSKFRISFESKYCIGDEVLYETTAIKERVVVPVFMTGRIKSINISPFLDTDQISIKYELEDNNVINPDDVKGYLNHYSNNLF